MVGRAESLHLVLEVGSRERERASVKWCKSFETSEPVETGFSDVRSPTRPRPVLPKQSYQFILISLWEPFPFKSP